MVLVCVAVHGVLGYSVVGLIDTARVVAAEADSTVLVVSPDKSDHLERFALVEQSLDGFDTPRSAQTQLQWEQAEQALAKALARARKDIYGGDWKDHRTALEDHIERYGSAGFRVMDINDPIAKLDTVPAFFWIYAGLVIAFWLFMLICQGEGLDLDITKRRHPHWEWLLSHPVRPVVAFSGEYLGPLMANPIYLTAPVFWFVIFNALYPFANAVVGALMVGLCLAVATSCLNKSIEIAAMLRLQIRNRGVFLGLLSLFGYISMLLPLFLIQDRFWSSQLLISTVSMPESFSIVRVLILGWQQIPILWQSVFSGFMLSAFIMLMAACLTWWGTRHGLQATESAVKIASTDMKVGTSAWIKNAYYRKEMLWLRRDKAAVVQIVLIPFVMVAVQAFNLRSVAQSMAQSWSALCGLAIIFGTFFLLVVGPRSLSSEGGALWLAQTWPRSLESLLKAKARLWFGFSTCVAYSILTFAVVLFPAHWWQILLVGLAWPLFSWTLALKSVCLVVAPSSSGQSEKAPQGRQWAALLGTFTFASGVFAQSWHVAIIGVVFSALSAIAMWQGLRTRLPYLFDPWSEPLPQPPTLMQAMVSIVVMVECLGIATALATAMGTAEQLWLTRAIGYALVGSVGWFLMQDFLSLREVLARDIWIWDNKPHSVSWLVASLFSGAVLAAFAAVYLTLLRALPLTSQYMSELDKLNAQFDDGILWQLVLIAGLVPFVEEYFFRGLLYRALDREIGGWLAIISSSAFFAVYHPPVAWVPVFLLGLITAWIFKKGGRLLPCVLVHMMYNFIVVGWLS